MTLPQTTDWIPLRNSERPVPAGSKWLAPVDASEPIMITIRVRPGAGPGGGAPADPRDLERVQEFAGEIGLDIIESSPARRSVVLWGTAAAMRSAFRVELAHYRHGGKVRRGQIGPVYLPPTIAHIVEDVSGLDDAPSTAASPAPAAALPRTAPRVTMGQIGVPLIGFVIASGLGFLLLYRAHVSTPAQPDNVARTVVSRPAPTAVPGATAPRAPTPGAAAPGAAPSLPPKETMHDVQVAQIESAAWKALDGGRLHEAQDYFLRVLSLDPARYTAMRGLVAVRKKMGGDDAQVIRKQVSVYQDAVTRGVPTEEYYTSSALQALVTASLEAAKEIEAQHPRPAPMTAAIPPVPPASAAQSADSRSGDPKPVRPSAVAGKPAPVQRPGGFDANLPQPAVPPAKPPVHAAVTPPATPPKPDKPPVAATAPQKPPVPNNVAATPHPPTPPAVPAPAPALTAPPAAPASAAPTAPPAPNHLYAVRIGPVTDRDRAAALAKQLAAEGFSQPQVSAQNGYRVVSEPLPRQVAGELTTILAGRGFHVHGEPLAGDSVQLVFGAAGSQKEAEALAARVTAAGYDAWIREAQVYTLHLGPVPQSSVTTITQVVKAGAPEATVDAEVVGTSASASPAPASSAPAPAPRAPVVAAPPVHPAPAPAPTPAAPAPAPPAAPAPAAPPAPNRMYMVRIGPMMERDRAAAIAKQLSAEGFSQAQVSAQNGYRVVSEPLPRQVASDLGSTLAARGLHSYAESLAGDSVHLVFGVFGSQKEAEALSARITAAGYDAWIREAQVYTVRLGPVPQTSVTTITQVVKAGSPDTSVAADPVPGS